MLIEIRIQFLLLTLCGSIFAESLRELPKGILELHSPMVVDGFNITLRGHKDGTTIHLAADFQGKAAILVKGKKIRLEHFTIEGNRQFFNRRSGLPPSDKTFAEFHDRNGILADTVEELEIIHVTLQRIPAMAVIVRGGNRILLHHLHVENSGGLNDKNRNNATGGILIEDGASNFTVESCSFLRIRGNALWTHSRYKSPRNRDGVFRNNQFQEIGRDAIQIGHATRVKVDQNSGKSIGYPTEIVDAEGGGTPVAVDTAGNVDLSAYTGNRFEEINGKCIDLDGFHHGEVSRNRCFNSKPGSAYPYGHFGIVMNNTNPDMQSAAIRIVGNEIEGMKFGAMFIIGTGHTIVGNVMRRINTAHCTESGAACTYFDGEPDLLRSGIYFGRHAERPATTRDNKIEDNTISGWKMQERCFGFAPGVSRTDQKMTGNRCISEEAQWIKK